MSSGTSNSKPSRLERRAQRSEDFMNQGAKTASEFNFNQHNPKNREGTHVSGQEARHVAKQFGGKAAYDELTKQKEAGAQFGGRAEGKYARLKAKFKNMPDGLDVDVAEKSAGGTQWDHHDQARYDAHMAKKRGDAKERAQSFQGSTQEQKVNQDNDINSSVQGNNNYVSNTQDNSVRYFGGNTTNFNYQSSGEGPDTPATMMTLAGIGNPQDSPADTARFIGKYSTLNRDLQKGYANTGMDVANKYVARAAQTNPIDYQALDQQISQGIQTHYDNATQQQALYQGDVFNFKTPEFKMPKPPKPIESNVSDIADDYKDELDDD